jgi:hypothetical protein
LLQAKIQTARQTHWRAGGLTAQHLRAQVSRSTVVDLSIYRRNLVTFVGKASVTLHFACPTALALALGALTLCIAAEICRQRRNL